MSGAADILTAPFAVQPQRRGDSRDTIVVMADELAEVAAGLRDNALLPDQAAELDATAAEKNTETEGDQG